MTHTFRLALVFFATTLLGFAGPASAESYVRFTVNDAVHYGLLEGDQVAQLSGDYFSDPKPTGERYPLEDVGLLLPLDPTRVSKILGTAVNTRRPNLEVAEDAHPRWFAKFPSSLNENGGNVMLPPEAGNLNYEGELVVVIGKEARHVSEEDALDYVFGYTVGNDFSENTWYGERKGRGEPSRLISKGSDTWACLGNVIVTGINHRDRRLVTTLNGKVVQDGNTNDLIQDVPKLISYASRYITLMPGDLIYTGTVPFQEGARRKMQVGDRLTVTIDGIGTVENQIVEM
ncbi:MAG: fumarylacetoacetate hydrolase family protein [Pseudomonadota bacterium]